MKPKIFYTVVILSILSVFYTNLFSMDAQTEAQKLFLSAKRSTVSQEWQKAIQQYDEIISNYAATDFIDDAQFWRSYCLEKEGKDLSKAFEGFEYVVENFPTSPWSDDAVIHQVAIAEIFVQKGQNQYRDFLVDKLTSDVKEVRQEAALALGKLGDKRALPILGEIKDSGEDEEFISDLITWIESKETKPNAYAQPNENESSFEITFSDSSMSDEKEYQKKLLIESNRFKQYMKMLKDDNSWTQDELIDFALWYILPPQDFDNYFSLSGYDKAEWLRKYWIKRDPTPTTDENEFQDEIMRRIEYAREHYSTAVNFHQFEFQRFQYLSVRQPRAPWDARGELYIKYGKADVNKMYSYQTEQWTYWDLKIDFLVKQYMTNVMGNAIAMGPMTQSWNSDVNFLVNREIAQDYPNAPSSSLQGESIQYSKGAFQNRAYRYNQEFLTNKAYIYKHDYKADEIKNVELNIDFNKTNAGNIAIDYKIPSDQFKIKKENGNYIISYIRRYVIFDSDMRKVTTNKETKIIYGNKKQDIREQKLIKEKIIVNLQPGEYQLALRIEDENENKIGIYLKNFVINE